MGGTHSAGEQLPLSLFLELERAYEKGIKEGEDKLKLFRRLERQFIDTVDGGLWSRGNSRLSLGENANESSSQRPVSPHNVQLTPKPYTPQSPPSSNVSPRHLQFRSPGMTQTKLSRPRPKSASRLDPHRIDRDKKSHGPRRSTIIGPIIKMSFETLWYVAWVSVSERLGLESLPLLDHVNGNSFPAISNNNDLILLIYLLRSLSREYEGQVKVRLRLLGKRSPSTGAISLCTSTHQEAGPFINNLSNVSVKPNTRDSSITFKSNEEIALLTSLRLMHECHLFLDTYFSTEEPKSGSWRQEIDVIFINSLRSQQISDEISLLGSTSTLAFHLIRSIEHVVTKRLIPIEEDSAERGWPIYHRDGPGAKPGRAAERQKAKACSNKLPKKPSVFMNHIPKATAAVCPVLVRLLDCAMYITQDKFHCCSEFDTFEMFVRAMQLLLKRIYLDLKDLPQSNVCQGEQSIDYEVSRCRWKAGPVILEFADVMNFDKEAELASVSERIEIVMKQSIRFFSQVNINTLQKLCPAQLSFADFQCESYHTEVTSLPVSRNRSNHSLEASQVLNRTKKNCLNYKMPPPEWELRVRKIRKILKPCLENIDRIISLVKHRRMEAAKLRPDVSKKM